MRVYVNNKSVTQAVYSTKLVDDKRLRLNVACVKDVLSRDILAMQWIPGQLQLFNCMTKRGASCYQLMQIIKTGSLELMDMMDAYNF